MKSVQNTSASASIQEYNNNVSVFSWSSVVCLFYPHLCWRIRRHSPGEDQLILRGKNHSFRAALMKPRPPRETANSSAGHSLRHLAKPRPSREPANSSAGRSSRHLIHSAYCAHQPITAESSISR